MSDNGRPINPMKVPTAGTCPVTGQTTTTVTSSPRPTNARMPKHALHQSSALTQA